MARSMLTVRIARWSAKHPWRAIGAWILFVGVCIGAGAISGTKTVGFDDNPTGELAVYKNIVDEAGFERPTSENVLISAKSGSLDTQRAMAAANDVRSRMTALKEAGTVSDPIPSPKGTAVLVNVDMTGKSDTAVNRVQPLLDATAAVQKSYPDLRIEQVGGASLEKAIGETLGKDFQKAEFFSLPVTLLIMLIVFGALIAASVPVLLAMSAVGAAIGLSGLASHLIPATMNTNSMILLIGMAVGVDYSLFYVRREREERAKGNGHVDAVEIAAATSGRAIVVSGVAVTVAMAGMFVVNNVVFSSIALGTIMVVLAAMIGSVTVLPALLAKLGRWVDRPRIPLLWRLSARTKGEPKFWRAVLSPSLRAPWITLVISCGALVALAIPAFGMSLNAPSAIGLPASNPIVQSYERVTDAFPSTGAAHAIAVRVPADQTSAAKSAVNDLVTRIGSDSDFANDRPARVDEAEGGRILIVTASIPDDASSPEADKSLTKLRTELLPQTVGKVAGAEYAVSGQTAGENDFVRDMNKALPWVIGFVLLLTLLVMLWAFRAPVMALSAIALNLLSVGAAYGVLVLVFQNSWAEGLLGFESTGGIEAWIPVIMFVVLFGLSMDYHVFVVSRIREAAKNGLDTRDAVARGITTSAGVVTSAAAVMIAVFSIFATLSTVDMKQMGIGLATAILVDATIIRAVVLPALMNVLGKSNWWTPKWLQERDRTPIPAQPAGHESLEPVHH